MAVTPGSANAPWRAPCCAWGVPPGALESRTWRMHTVPGRGWWDGDLMNIGSLLWTQVNHLFLWAIYTMAMLNNQMVIAIYLSGWWLIVNSFHSEWLIVNSNGSYLSIVNSPLPSMDDFSLKASIYRLIDDFPIYR